MLSLDEFPILLEKLDVAYNDKIDDQYVCDCIFCGKENHFYLKPDGKDFLWDCKRCGKIGNKLTFLHEFWSMVYDQQESSATNFDERLSRLSKEKRVPIKALLDAKLIWYGDRWYIPIFNKNENVVSMRYFIPNSKFPIRGLSGIKNCLWGLNDLHNSKAKEVYICEGEWDAIIFKYLLKKKKLPGIVVAVPGAGTFKHNWSGLFVGKTVNILFDNDTPGRDGTEKIIAALTGVAKVIRYVKWPDDLPESFDIKDFINNEGTIDVLEDMLIVHSKGSRGIAKDVRKSDQNKAEKPSVSERISFQEVIAVYNKWLHMTQDLVEALKITFATVYSNQLSGDPLWVHLVGPAGSGKTQIVMSCAEYEECFAVSSLSPHMLVSGFSGGNGADPSLMPQILGKTLIIKDFTEVVQMPRIHKDEIYATLRGAFDGYVYKKFGNNVVREYFGTFSMITGVTPAVFADQANSSLGERFLMYQINKSDVENVEDIIMKAMSNSGKEVLMKQELGEISNKFMHVHIDPKDFVMPHDYLVKIISLAQLVGLLRSVVERDQYKGTILYRPVSEVGTRLAKQLVKLATGLYYVEGEKFTEEDWNIVQKVAVDTCIGFNVEIVAFISGNKKEVGIQEISEGLELQPTNVRNVVVDLMQLGILTCKTISSGGRPKNIYKLSKHVAVLWEKSEMEKIRKFIYNPRVRKGFRKSR